MTIPLLSVVVSVTSKPTAGGGAEQQIARAAGSHYGLSPYRISRDGRPGLIFGYATLGERVLTEGIEILAEAISGVRSRDGTRPC